MRSKLQHVCGMIRRVKSILILKQYCYLSCRLIIIPQSLYPVKSNNGYLLL